MLTFTRFTNGIIRTTYPRRIETNGQVLDIVALDEQTQSLVCDVVRQFGFLFPVGKELSLFQVSQVIEQHSDDPTSVELVKQLQNLSIQCVLTA